MRTLRSILTSFAAQVDSTSRGSLLTGSMSRCFALALAVGLAPASSLAQQWLLIFRRGHWDLPKGKIDPGETPEQAAIREVQEETGLRELTLGPALPASFHTYRDQQDRRVLKQTYWYLMDTKI